MKSEKITAKGTEVTIFQKEKKDKNRNILKGLNAIKRWIKLCPS